MDFIYYRSVKISKDFAYNDLKIEVSTLYKKRKLDHPVISEAG